MSVSLVEIITSPDRAVRDRALESACQDASTEWLLDQCAALEHFRHTSESLYERVRALFFLYAIHRFHLPARQKMDRPGFIPFRGYAHLLERRFEEAIDMFAHAQDEQGPSEALSSALAAAYHRLAFQTLADQVRRSVRAVRGNQWMFRMGHPADHPLRLRRELLRLTDGAFPILRERTPVRMDLTHTAWSDIFFLGMDFPEGARVLNVSIDLAVHGRDPTPRPPVEAYLRVIDEPVLRLVSVDLKSSVDLDRLPDVFDFARDYLGLLKAAVIASGLIPPGLEASGQELAEVLQQLAGPGRGLELVSCVNDIPKGSRLAVSTNLLAALIAVCMRATGQTKNLSGPLEESERRLVLARAILGEWLGGSGGGWQDSGGVWPGIKLIEGVSAAPGDIEWGASRGKLLPQHRILGEAQAGRDVRRRLQESLVLVHGGMAQNVGPILEMVTEKYLLRSAAEWEGRQRALMILDEVLEALRAGDIRQLGAATTRNFVGPIQTIIPWATTAYTELLIERVRERFGDRFWGFWMLGGMSGGGMGFMFDPLARAAGIEALQEIMPAVKRDLEHGLPFAMEPVVYDFAINDRGTLSDCLDGTAAVLPAAYYALTVPQLLRQDPRKHSTVRRAELDRFGAACRTRPELRNMVQVLFDALLPRSTRKEEGSLSALLEANGFDRALHEQIRTELRSGRIGLAQNRLPPSAEISDARPEDVVDAAAWKPGEEPLEYRRLGEDTLRRGEVAVLTLAAGAGTRWTQGAGVVKALHPFCKFQGRHRTFIETHLAKSRRSNRRWGIPIPHLFSTSYLTNEPIAEFLARRDNYGYEGPLRLSPSRSVGLRLVPLVRDLRFAWEELPQQRLDEQAQKVRDSLRRALMDWAQRAGEATDYTDNVPGQCLHPVGHWYEVPNLFRNGVLAQLLRERPQLRYILLHNIDTLGADLDPALLGLHIHQQACLSFEVIARRIEDRGGGLARVNLRPRLVEGLAMPEEEAEFKLSYYNTMTTWIDVDRLLNVFGLTRSDLEDSSKVTRAIRQFSAKMPTYVTLKEVKKRWGHGQEDTFPVTQFEKLWGDMTALPEVECRFVVVPKQRGQQLKEPAQLDGWLRDGSAAYIDARCEW